MEKTYKNCQSCGMPFRNDQKVEDQTPTEVKVQATAATVMKMENLHSPTGLQHKCRNL